MVAAVPGARRAARHGEFARRCYAQRGRVSAAGAGPAPARTSALQGRAAPGRDASPAAAARVLGRADRRAHGDRRAGAPIGMSWRYPFLDLYARAIPPRMGGVRQT